MLEPWPVPVRIVHDEFGITLIANIFGLHIACDLGEEECFEAFQRPVHEFLGIEMLVTRKLHHALGRTGPWSSGLDIHVELHGWS